MLLTLTIFFLLSIAVNSRGCGQRFPEDRLKRVVGGQDATPNTWPWQVSIQLAGTGKDGSHSYHHCGGSIINNYWILTVEHCREPLQWTNITVIAGLQNIKDYYLWTSNQTVETNRLEMWQTNPHMSVHEPDSIFVPDSYDNDLNGEVMLIKLKTPITYTQHVSPVCLPKQWQDFRTRTKLWLTGWGTTKWFGDSPMSLQEVQLQLIDRELCNDLYSQSELADTPHVSDNMLCAGIYPGGGYGPCHGDSGGPLVSQYKGHWVQTGIVSWGGKCGGEHTPGVFVNVANFVNWIQDTISKNP